MSWCTTPVSVWWIFAPQVVDAPQKPYLNVSLDLGPCQGGAISLFWGMGLATGNLTSHTIPQFQPLPPILWNWSQIKATSLDASAPPYSPSISFAPPLSALKSWWLIFFASRPLFFRVWIWCVCVFMKMIHVHVVTDAQWLLNVF